MDSASGMKVTGGTRPCSGWRQRISASTPTTAPDWLRVIGWKCSENSPLRTPSYRSASSLSRSASAGSSTGAWNDSALPPDAFACDSAVGTAQQRL
jgi:hypothetical protein